MMRIGHVITRFIRGGADENTLYTCNGQARLGHEVHLVFGRDADEKLLSHLDSRVARHQIFDLKRAISPLDDLSALLKLHRLFIRLKLDVVHSHTSKAGILGRVAARIARVPIIIHGVHILPFINVNPVLAFSYRILERAIANFTDAFVNVGEEMRKGCIEAGIGVFEKHSVIASGMDLSRFSDALLKREDWRQVLPDVKLKTERPRFLLLVSRLEPRKGQYDFLPVFSRLSEAFPDAVLILAGEGPDRLRLEQRIKMLSLENRVILTGFREDIERLMGIAEIGLLTSMREGLPRVLVQYALMRLPVVATDISGVREIIIPGETGYIVPSSNLSNMLDPLRELLGSEEAGKAMRLRLGQLDFSRWSIENMNRQLNDLYHALLQEKHAQRLYRMTL